MRFLIVADVHGNWEALKSVLRRVRRKRFDGTLVLGDLVGYGASPNLVVEAMRNLPGKVTLVRGNHDKVAVGLEDGAGFNEVALLAAKWTSSKLTSENMAYLRSLPAGPLAIADAGGGGLAICHGSPADEDTYLLSEMDAWAGFSAAPSSQLIFFGHTHLPSFFELSRNQGLSGRLLQGDRGKVQLQPDSRYLINPGSVGQPRDHNPFASYMIYDSEKRVVHWHRVRYAIAGAQRRIRAAGLPETLAERLRWGV